MDVLVHCRGAGVQKGWRDILTILGRAGACYEGKVDAARLIRSHPRDPIPPSDFSFM